MRTLPDHPKNLYFMGIGGTGMAACAGLAQEAGFRVMGSDMPLYPPMSTLLDTLGLTIRSPYQEANLKAETPDLVIIANAISRGHPELEYVLKHQIPYTSFPGFLEHYFLTNRKVIVVAGTHGKTTTTSWISHALIELGKAPGYLIGGIPLGKDRGYALGQGELFVIEGDEYDTAFFDKGPKFLHYNPSYLVLNNLEFDHADIYQDLSAIKQAFRQLIKLLPPTGNAIANLDEAHLMDCLAQVPKEKLCTTSQKTSAASVHLLKATPTQDGSRWLATFQTQQFGELSIRSALIGPHNMANLANALGLLLTLKDSGELSLDPPSLIAALESFQGVTRRLQKLTDSKGILVFEDFAHHPSAADTVIKTLKTTYPHKRLVVVFEPKNATSRRNIFVDRYAEVLSQADLVFLGAVPPDQRIPEAEKMNTFVLAQQIASQAQAFDSNDSLLTELKRTTKPNDVVVFMSPGGFANIQHRFKSFLETPPPSPPPQEKTVP